jgi:hypothetical protein
MAVGALLASTVLMGLLLVTVAFWLDRLGDDRGYTPTLGAAGGGGRGGAAGTTGTDSVSSDQLMLFVVLVTLVIGAVAVAVGDGVMVFGALAGTVLLGYLGSGVYLSARSRGLPQAHAVGVSVWIVSMVLIAGLGLKLLLG